LWLSVVWKLQYVQHVFRLGLLNILPRDIRETFKSRSKSGVVLLPSFTHKHWISLREIVHVQLKFGSLYEWMSVRIVDNNLAQQHNTPQGICTGPESLRPASSSRDISPILRNHSILLSLQEKMALIVSPGPPGATRGHCRPW